MNTHRHNHTQRHTNTHTQHTKQTQPTQQPSSTNLPRPGARRRRRRSAAPRQEVAGRAEYVIRIHSKLGGEASPSLRWLRFCRRPFPPTNIYCYFSTLSVTFYTQNQALTFIVKKTCMRWPPGAQKAKCEQTWLPKRLHNRAQNPQKISFQRLRVKKVDVVKTSVFTVSNTHRTPPGLNNFP